MTLRRFLICFAIALAAEVGVFAVSYRDLVFLSQGPDAIRRGSAEMFATRAARALSRRQLTRQHLETIATTAAGFGLTAVERRALDRLVSLHPAEAGLRLRLADVLRRTGEFDRAEQLYVDLLTLPAETHR